MPFIQPENCTQCLKCAKDCPSKAINIESFSIDSTCIHCGHCVAICPERAVMPDIGEIVPLRQVEITGNQFRDLSASVRTCRNYTAKEVPLEIIHQLVENMKHYPSASNKRELQITVINSPEKIQELNDKTVSILLNALRMITLPVLKHLIKIFVPTQEVNYLASYREKFIGQQATNKSQVCHHAPAVMLFHAPKSPFSLSGEDAFIWATYTSIYANTLGLGTCFNGFIVQAMKRSKSLRKKFNLPDDHQIHAALLLGYPKVKYKNEVSRKSPKSSIF